MRPARIFLLLVVIGLILAIYWSKNQPKSVVSPTQPVATPTAQISSNCDSSLWRHIWNPWRLKILTDCKTVTGALIQKFLAEDGDYHLLLEPDDKTLGKTLVVEIICAGKIDKDVKVAQKACEEYINQIAIPAIDDHLQVTGSYVFDTSHNWNEIHPVSSLEMLK